jgi:hypothetical protein
MSTANTSITREKDRLYFNQTAVEQNNNNNNNKSKQVLTNSQTSKHVMAQKQFLICQDCFWCASYYAYDTAGIPLKYEISNIAAAHCPGCNTKGGIESLLIS